MESPAPSYDQHRLSKLKAFSEKYEVSHDNVIKLRQLEDFDTVIICDDSGSMLTTIDDNTTVSGNAFAAKTTRWDILRRIVTIVVEASTALDKNGVDIYFLNRPPLLGTWDVNQITEAFQFPPQGYTPTIRVMQQVLASKADVLKERKLLVILATDGRPTDDLGNDQAPQFPAFIKSKPGSLYLSIVACTDDDQAVNFLDELMEMKIPNVDVTEDYKAECAEVKSANGPSYPFSFGDYICKIMLGSVDDSFGDKALGLIGAPPKNSGCCMIS